MNAKPFSPVQYFYKYDYNLYCVKIKKATEQNDNSNEVEGEAPTCSGASGNNYFS